MRQTRKASASFLLLTAVPERRKRIPLARWGRQRKSGIFLNHKENRVKSKIFTMVFFGERKSILPGAKAEADLEGFPASLFLIVLADREEKSKLKKGQLGLKPVSNNGFASTTNPRAKFSRTCTT